ncbi:hypothetical protein Lumi_101 [Xylophilus phage Lumi]|nr:hypothetical protein Lumi_101 [Xylophilus phage Lumi]
MGRSITGKVLLVITRDGDDYDVHPYVQSGLQLDSDADWFASEIEHFTYYEDMKRFKVPNGGTVRVYGRFTLWWIRGSYPDDDDDGGLEFELIRVLRRQKPRRYYESKS